MSKLRLLAGGSCFKSAAESACNRLLHTRSSISTVFVYEHPASERVLQQTFAAVGVGSMAVSIDCDASWTGWTTHPLNVPRARHFYQYLTDGSNGSYPQAIEAPPGHPSTPPAIHQRRTVPPSETPSEIGTGSGHAKEVGSNQHPGLPDNGQGTEMTGDVTDEDETAAQSQEEVWEQQQGELADAHGAGAYLKGCSCKPDSHPGAVTCVFQIHIGQSKVVLLWGNTYSKVRESLDGKTHVMDHVMSCIICNGWV